MYSAFSITCYLHSMGFVNFNGKLFPDNEPVLTASNQSYRYGDGLFETLKMVDGEIALFDRHMDRLFAGLQLLQYKIPALFTREQLHAAILALCKKNKCETPGRIRLSVSRGQGGLYDGDNKLQFLIECWPAGEQVMRLNENGLVLGSYDQIRKSCDAFSGIKSASYLPYVMAAQMARSQHWNDCLVLNPFGRFCDSSIANLFWIKENLICTPPLSEGPVAGVMRAWLLEQLPAAGFAITEKNCTLEELATSDELFLTNAMYGLRWVRSFQDYTYSNTIAQKIYNQLFQTNRV
jgi:branched-chain amino acid aminotransferase